MSGGKEGGKEKEAREGNLRFDTEASFQNGGGNAGSGGSGA